MAMCDPQDITHNTVPVMVIIIHCEIYGLSHDDANEAG